MRRKELTAFLFCFTQYFILSYSVSLLEASIYCIQSDQVLCFAEGLFTYLFKFYAWTYKPCTNKEDFIVKFPLLSQESVMHRIGKTLKNTYQLQFIGSNYSYFDNINLNFAPKTHTYSLFSPKKGFTKSNIF